MAEKLDPNDEVTLVATIVVRYSAERGLYAETPDSQPDDAMMAWIDQDGYERRCVSVYDILDWADGSQNVSVKITPETVGVSA